MLKQQTMRQQHNMKHVICINRLNYQDTPLNQNLKELKVDAKAEQKNRTDVKFANTFSSNLICKAQKAQ